MEITNLETIELEFMGHEIIEGLGLVPSEQADHFEPVTEGRFFSHDILDHPRRKTMKVHGFLGDPCCITGELQAHGVLGWGLVDTGKLLGNGSLSNLLEAWLGALANNFYNDYRNGILVFEEYTGPYPFPAKEDDRPWIFNDDHLEKSKEIFKDDSLLAELGQAELYDEDDDSHEYVGAIELARLLEENHLLLWQWIYHGYMVGEKMYVCQHAYIETKEQIQKDFNRFMQIFTEYTWAGCNVEVDFRYNPYTLNFRIQRECQRCYRLSLISSEEAESFEFCDSCAEEIATELADEEDEDED